MKITFLAVLLLTPMGALNAAEPSTVAPLAVDDQRHFYLFP